MRETNSDRKLALQIQKSVAKSRQQAMKKAVSDFEARIRALADTVEQVKPYLDSYEENRVAYESYELDLLQEDDGKLRPFPAHPGLGDRSPAEYFDQYRIEEEDLETEEKKTKVRKQAAFTRIMRSTHI